MDGEHFKAVHVISPQFLVGREREVVALNRSREAVLDFKKFYSSKVRIG